MDVSSEEWDSEPYTIHYNYIRDTDPRKNIYVYADDGAGVSSRLMAVHSLRMFTDPNQYGFGCLEDRHRYRVQFIDAEGLAEKNWEEDTALLLFPGGADRYYSV